MAKRDVIDVLIAEAIGEGDQGLAAVAWTILNRAAETGRTPAQVIADPGDYTGATNPGSATKKAMKDPKVRARVERVWDQVQSGSIPDPTGGATHYWAPKGMKGGKAPYWADEEESAAGRLKIGNHVFLPKQKPNSALSAINAVAPTPMPSRPVALGYAQNTGTPAPTVPSAPPGMRALSDSNAAFGVLPFSKTFNPGIYPLEGQGINLWARDRSGDAAALIAAASAPRTPAPRLPSPQMSAARTPPAPSRGVGTSYLAPATKVKTVPIDPVTGNPILAQATPSPRSPVGYGPSWDNLKGMTVGAWDDAAPWNNVGPRPKPFVGGVVPSQSKQTPQQIVNERTLAGIPVIGPLAVGLGTAADLVQRIAPPQASATPQPQPTKLPSAVPSVPLKPALTQAQRSALASQGDYRQAVEIAPPLQSTPIKVATTIKDGKLVVTKAPSVRDVPKPYDRLPTAYPITGDDIASALYPKPAATSATKAISAATLPRLPMMPSPAMSAARLPTVPVRTAPIAPARTPLPQTRTVNPMTQIVPAVQARAGQGLLGGLFNMFTAGNVPQANTIPRGAPTPRPAWQNNPNVQRDDKWAGVLDNFGMII